MRQQRIPKGGEYARLIRTEMIGRDQVPRGARLGLILVMPMRIVPTAAASYLIGGQTEKKKVLLTSFLGHLDRRAVAGADRQSSIHHELHVAGTTGLVAGS